MPGALGYGDPEAEGLGVAAEGASRLGAGFDLDGWVGAGKAGVGQSGWACPKT